MSMTQRLTIFDVRITEGVAKKSGLPYRIAEAQCLLHKTDEKESSLVGTLSLPKGMEDPKPGDYHVEFRMGVDFEGNIGARVHKLEPVIAQPRAPGAAPAQAARAGV